MSTKWYTAVISIFSITSVAYAGQIGINFQGGDAAPLASGDVTGVVAQDHWNNADVVTGAGTYYATSAGLPGTFTGAQDSSGAATGLSVAYTANENVGYNPVAFSPNPSAYTNLYASRLESPYAASNTNTFANAENNRVKVSLTSIPYATYNLYVYTGGNPGLVYESASPNDTVSSHTGMAYTAMNPGTFVAGVNYVEFTGLTSPNVYLIASDATNSGGGGFNSGFAGVQIVEVQTPEPASMGLLALAGVAMAGAIGVAAIEFAQVDLAVGR